ncbi:DUF882 domain-containing protein [Ensifer soli]|uniref:DUF882 domain-containing protein n=1 Tax=Ciceribacter sp. sgz301302 TaxID=3342379 RepID=UPI0035BADEB7
MQTLFGLKNAGGHGRDTGRAALVRKVPRFLASLLIALTAVLPPVAPPAEAAGQTRTLKLYFIHTREKAAITFKRNGRYDQKGLQQIGQFLRDWRRNEPTRMDPRLLDLVWEVYQKSGSRDYIHVVSAYRSPETNGMLRSRSKGVAKKSQHMLGKAMDFYIPDVKLKTLREIGMKFQVGGVGYYPTSGSPFVHMDVGGVRAWPRMSRTELVRLFPDGKTLHLPSDGKPLPGYDQAVADYKRRVGADAIQVAGGGAKGPGDVEKKRPNLFAMLFGAGGDEDEEPNAISSGETVVAEKPAPRNRATIRQAEAEPVVAAVAPAETPSFAAPVPANRPVLTARALPADTPTEVALVEQRRNAAAEAIAAALPQTSAMEQQFNGVATSAIPVPSLRDRRVETLGTAVETAALTPEAMPAVVPEAAAELAHVPVPAMRPVAEATLLAVAEANVAIPSFADRSAATAAADLSPDPTAVAVADEPAAQPTAASTRVALATPVEKPRERFTPPVEMASFAPQKSADARAMVFDDAFDTGRKAVTKATRPTGKDAAATAPATARTAEPVLTEKIISEWALSTGRMASLSKPVKAPRFVSRSMRAAPTTVYAAGFSSGPATMDTGRFSGTAVNFMEVKKFGTE